ncbi:reverse transcriptase, partial [Phytophthora megakarya]
MDFVFGLPRDSRRKTGIVVFVDRFSKMVHLAAVAAEVTSVQTARLFVDVVFKHHGMPTAFVSDRDPRFRRVSGKKCSHFLEHGSTVAPKQPQNSADTNLSAAMTRARARARTRQSDVSVPNTDTVKNHEQAIPAATKDNVSVRGTDTEKIHAQAGPEAITPEVSVPGTDIPKSHAQSGTDATTSGESVQGTDADKINELDPGFSSQAMDFVHERQAVVRFVQDAIAASAERQKLNADNNGR